MLELRPTCEHCNTALPPASTDAMVCSYECTFCRTCVDEVLHNICPNCGGGFAARPIRPARNWRGDNYLDRHPAGERVVNKPVDAAAHEALRARIGPLAPEQR